MSKFTTGDLFCVIADYTGVYNIQKYTGKPPIGSTGYLDQFISNEFCWGYDDHGRLFLNLPVVCHQEGRNPSESSFVIFQRYSDNLDMVTTAGDDDPVAALMTQELWYEIVAPLLGGHPVPVKDGHLFIRTKGPTIDGVRVQ